MLNPSALLDPSVPHRTVIEEARKAWQRNQMSEYVLCIALRRLRKDQVHRGSGLSTIQDYAEFTFGIPPGLGSVFVEIGKHLERLPKTRAAMELGEITYTKVREFMRIATEEDEASWIRYAKTHTNRQLEKHVQRTKAEREGREHQDKRTVKSRLNGEQVQVARKAREVLKKEGERSVPEAELLPRMLDLFARNELPAQQEAEGNGKAPKPVGPYLAIHLCPKCLHTWVPVARENMELSPVRWIEEMRDGGDVHNLLPDLLCDCEDVIHRRDECPDRAPPSGGGGRNRYGGSGPYDASTGG